MSVPGFIMRQPFQFPQDPFVALPHILITVFNFPTSVLN